MSHFEEQFNISLENPGFTGRSPRSKHGSTPYAHIIAIRPWPKRMSQTKFAKDRDNFQPFLKSAYVFLWKEFRKAGLAGP